jgi:hypothetical protein
VRAEENESCIALFRGLRTHATFDIADELTGRLYIHTRRDHCA